MWTHQTQTLENGRLLKVCLNLDSAPVSYSEVLRRWQTDADFRAWFISLLADAPFSAFRWETPPITTTTSNRPFEFALTDSPGLASNPEPHAFAEHFNGGSQGVIEFSNLGKDAILVVPKPNGPSSAYGHLAAFVRHAPESQRDELWKAVGDAMQRRLSAKPVWLSTAGAGVSWLHVRLDDRPKYYGHAPYRGS
jgi:hypothetical protein